MQNPFQYGKVIGAPYFTDRERELAELISEVENRHNLVLYSPRRYGKTSLLMKLAAELKSRDIHVIFIDFMQVTSREAFIRLFTRELFRKTPGSAKTIMKKLAALVSGLRPAMEVDALGNASLSVRLDSSPVKTQALEEVLNLTETFDPKKRWLVICDEFQEIMKLNGDSFTATLRSVIQHHQRTSYIFCGSRYHLLLDMFNRPREAFYRFGKIIPLSKIEPEIMQAYLTERFASTGMKLPAALAERIISLADNIPNYVQFIAAELWQLAQLGGTEPSEELLSKALETVLNNQSDYFLQVWSGLSIQQKKLVSALAIDSGNPFSQDFHTKHRLGATSSTQRAMQKLISEQIVSKEDGSIIFGDPLFKLYIRSRFTE
ncbi:MAG: ATP-binding protein [Candidatus Cloacimonadota bacterium]